MKIKLEIDKQEINNFLFWIFWYNLIMRLSRLIYIITVFYFLLQTIAHAYIEPGTFSMIISFIVAIIASITFFIKDIFYKIKKFFSKKKDEEKENSNN